MKFSSKKQKLSFYYPRDNHLEHLVKKYRRDLRTKKKAIIVKYKKAKILSLQGFGKSTWGSWNYPLGSRGSQTLRGESEVKGLRD